MKATILGAIIGDTIGSTYEFHPTKDYHFNLMEENMSYTDDSIMTIAVADWLLNDSPLSHKTLSQKMRYWGNKYRYPMGGYGGRFSGWLSREEVGPYNSWGNGSAMRVSAVGFAFNTLEETLRYAQVSAEITHNHTEGIKGAQATAAAIYLARTGMKKEDIRFYISKMFDYDLSRTCNDIRPDYRFEESCQETVPQALIAFFDSTSYEDAIRLTISLGGDADTMGAITGAIAAAYYKEIPDHILKFTIDKLPSDLLDIVIKFEQKFGDKEETLEFDKIICRKQFTPERITKLKPNEIFVFGSNLEGRHAGGAARIAYNEFGAIWGNGDGIQGQSYAIPTMQGGISTIEPYVEKFIQYAKEHPELTFLVTRIGCGIAGFTDAEIAPLFSNAPLYNNIVLPESFYKIINKQQNL